MTGRAAGQRARPEENILGCIFLINFLGRSCTTAAYGHQSRRLSQRCVLAGARGKRCGVLRQQGPECVEGRGASKQSVQLYDSAILSKVDRKREVASGWRTGIQLHARIA